MGSKLRSVEEGNSSSEDFGAGWKMDTKVEAGHGHAKQKNSDEITFFQVGGEQGTESTSALSHPPQDKIAKQVVVSVSSTPIDPAERDREEDERSGGWLMMSGKGRGSR
jgi:hypothetical protein